MMFFHIFVLIHTLRIATSEWFFFINDLGSLLMDLLDTDIW
jgi:hypothetical protein